MSNNAPGFVLLLVLFGLVGIFGFCFSVLSSLGWVKEMVTMQKCVLEGQKELMSIVLQQQRLIKNHYDSFFALSSAENSCVTCRPTASSSLTIGTARAWGVLHKSSGLLCESASAILRCRWYIEKKQKGEEYVCIGHTFFTV